MKKNTLMTGPPGFGETSSIRQTAMMLREGADGFYTEEAREDGERMGFRISRWTARAECSPTWTSKATRRSVGTV